MHRGTTGHWRTFTSLLVKVVQWDSCSGPMDARLRDRLIRLAKSTIDESWRIGSGDGPRQDSRYDCGVHVFITAIYAMAGGHPLCRKIYRTKLIASLKLKTCSKTRSAHCWRNSCKTPAPWLIPQPQDACLFQRARNIAKVTAVK